MQWWDSKCSISRNAVWYVVPQTGLTDGSQLQTPTAPANVYGLSKNRQTNKNWPLSQSQSNGQATAPAQFRKRSHPSLQLQWWHIVQPVAIKLEPDHTQTLFTSCCNELNARKYLSSSPVHEQGPLLFSSTGPLQLLLTEHLCTQVIWNRLCNYLCAISLLAIKKCWMGSLNKGTLMKY